MGLVLANGIITRYTNYKENDRIVSIFTVEYGRIDAKARGCRKAQSPLLPAVQPFVYGEYELFRSQDKWTVNRASVSEAFYPIREDITKFAIASSMLQLAHEAANTEQPNEALFSLLYHSLSYLSYGTIDPDDLILVYLLRFMNTIGFRPSIISCASCGRDIRGDASLFYSARKGGAVCAACASGDTPVSKTVLEVMRRILILDDAELQRVVLNDPLRRALRKMLIPQVTLMLEYGSRALSFYTDICKDSEC